MQGDSAIQGRRFWLSHSRKEELLALSEQRPEMLLNNLNEEYSPRPRQRMIQPKTSKMPRLRDSALQV